MRRVLRFLVLLYPRSWRERYGREFEALLEDAAPRWRDLGDVVLSALAVQMRTWGFGKIVAALGLAGALVGTAASFALPERYVSEAVLRSDHADRTDPIGSAAFSHVLRRQSLEEVIRQDDLYEDELSQKPMEDVFLDMRHAIRISSPASGMINIAFHYDDRYKAQRALSDIVNLVRRELPDAEVRNAASLPRSPVEPNRVLVAGWGFGAGVLLAVVVGLFLPPVRLAVALGLTGAIVVWGVSLAIPERYVSTGVVAMRTANGAARDHEIDEYIQSLTARVLDPISLTLLIERTRVYGDGKSTDELIARLRREIRIERISGSRGEFRISFEYGDPREAQRVTALLIESVMRENAQEKRRMVCLEVLEPGGLPKTPLGLVDRWRRRR
jgi:hypothetical protein